MRKFKSLLSSRVVITSLYITYGELLRSMPLYAKHHVHTNGYHALEGRESSAGK